MTKGKKKRPKKKRLLVHVKQLILASILIMQTKLTWRQTITGSPPVTVELVKNTTPVNNNIKKTTTLVLTKMEMIIMTKMAIKIIIKKMDTRRMKIISQGVTITLRVTSGTKTLKVETAMWRTLKDRKARALTLAVAKMENDY